MLREDCGCILDPVLDEWRCQSITFGFGIDRLDWRSGGLRLDDLPFKHADEIGKLEDGVRACLRRKASDSPGLHDPEHTVHDLRHLDRPDVAERGQVRRICVRELVAKGLQYLEIVGEPGERFNEGVMVVAFVEPLAGEYQPRGQRRRGSKPPSSSSNRSTVRTSSPAPGPTLPKWPTDVRGQPASGCCPCLARRATRSAACCLDPDRPARHAVGERAQRELSAKLTGVAIAPDEGSS